MPRRKRGSGSLYRKRGWYYAAFYVNGEQVTVATKTKDARKARDFLNAKLGEVAEGRYLGPAVDRTTFEDLEKLLLDDYRVNELKTLEKAERMLRLHLGPRFAGMLAKDIDEAEIQAYIAARKAATHGKKEKPTSNAEVNRETALLHRMFTLGLKARRVIRVPHIPRLRENNIRTGFFDRADFDRLLAALPEYLRAPLTFAYGTGWRMLSEVLTLTWDRVNLDEGTVRLEVGSTKNGEGRDIYVPAEVRAILEAQWIDHQTNASGCRYVFHRRGARIQSFYKAWRKACTAAGVEGRVPHDFRRSAVRNMVRAGIPERVAMQISGHKTRSIFDRYHIVSDGDLREAAARMDAANRRESGRITTGTTTDEAGQTAERPVNATTH